MPKRNIHKTWLNRKDRLQLKRDRGTQYAFGARNALRDAYRARQQFLDANDASEARIDWVTCVSLLRAVGHVLKKRDANRSAFLRMAVDEAWIRWKGSREANLIFFDFIDAERNALLKEFKSLMPVLGQEAPLPPASADTEVLIWAQVFKAHEILRLAIAWWERELREIERHAERLREHKRVPKHRSSRAITRNRSFGKVDIPQEAFIAALKMDGN